MITKTRIGIRSSTDMSVWRFCDADVNARRKQPMASESEKTE